MITIRQILDIYNSLNAPDKLYIHTRWTTWSSYVTWTEFSSPIRTFALQFVGHTLDRLPAIRGL